MDGARVRLAAQLESAVVPRLMLAMVLCVLAMLMYLQQASQMSVHQFAISNLQAEQSQLSLTNVNLHAQASQLRSVSRIQTIATTQLHMTPADPTKSIWVLITVPRVRPVVVVSSDTQAAKRISSPLHWMTTTLTWIREEL